MKRPPGIWSKFATRTGRATAALGVDRQRPAFRNLWMGQTISQFGSQVSLVAIPLLAAVTLRASAFDMGLLGAAETLPYLVVSIPAGAVVDRVDRRRLLIATDVGRAAILLAIPAAMLAGGMSIQLLYVVALMVGSLSVFFDVAYQSYVPELLPSDRLVEGNQRLELSASGARTAGPSLGGLLVGLVGGALAVVVDAASFLVSAVVLARAPAVRSVALGQSEGDDGSPGIWVGVRIVLRDRVLRDLAASTAIFNLASSAILAVFVLFATREAGISPLGVGLLFGIGNVGFLIGAGAVMRMSRALGIGGTLASAAALGALATILMPFAAGPLAPVVLCAARFTGAVATPIFNVNARALRQSRVPNSVLGRVNGTFRFLDWGALPIGSLLGGAVASAFGLRAALVLGACLGAASFAILVPSPLSRLAADKSSLAPSTAAPDADEAGATAQPSAGVLAASGDRLPVA